MNNRTISKSELGLRYFPQLSKQAAQKKLVEYISSCSEWMPSEGFKKRRYYTASEVKQIEKIMG